MTDYFGLSGNTSDQLRGMGYNVWTPPLEKGSFISEGDTPTFMNLLNNGLRAFEDSHWGGWGGIVRSGNAGGAAGRGGQVAPVGPDDPGIGIGIAPAGSDANKPVPAPATTPVAGRGGAGGSGRAGGFGRGGAVSPKTAAVNTRFFAAAQNDFAARLKWSVTPKFSDANHPPEVSARGPSPRKPVPPCAYRESSQTRIRTL